MNASLVSGLNSPSALRCPDRTCLSRTTATARLANTPPGRGERLPGLGVGLSVWYCRVWIGPVCPELGRRHDRRIHHSGAVVNASLVTGLNQAFTLAVTQPVPEPGTITLLGTALLGLGCNCAGAVSSCCWVLSPPPRITQNTC